MISRRAVLTTGGACLLVLGGGASALLSKDIESAREPWRQAEAGFGDVRLNALAYAILAPNPHNRQPWIVRLDSDDFSFKLFCDLQRLLPETDPLNRQITIGFGAFLELFKMAAAEQGYRTYIDPFPEGEPHPLLDERPVAAVRIAKDASVRTDPLFKYALLRRTVRSNFDTSRVPSKEDIDALLKTAALPDPSRFMQSSKPETVQTLRNLSLKGWTIESSTTRTHHESTALMRIGAKEVNAKPDGISLYGPVMEAYGGLGILTREKANNIGSAAYKGNVNFYNKLIETANCFGWLSTPDNSRTDQLRAGADWLRLNLAATKLGIAFHPLSQALQEFPEMSETYDTLHGYLGLTSPARIQGLFRFGYSAYPKAAPRWQLQSRLIGVA